MPNLAADLEFRGLVHQVTDPSLLARLERESLTFYVGFDPTADSLHIGHLLPVLTLRRLFAAGHRPIVLTGGATGVIGDPGGKSVERPLLTLEELQENLVGLRTQLAHLLAIAESNITMVDNHDWLGGIGYLDFLREIGKHVTVNQMVAKESVRARLDRPDQGISYTEFSYMLLQGYDFLHLFDHHDCRLQIGASDQWGNITTGIELVRKLRGAEVFGLTIPLVVKADGTKFGKSESGTVWLDPRRTSPYQLYQFLLRTEDTMVGTYLRYFTFLDHEEILALEESTVAHPERREAQRALARGVCELVHGPGETDGAERAAEALFSEAIGDLDEPTLLEVFAEAPASEMARSVLDGSGLSVVDVLAATGLVRSKTQARTTVRQGGAYVNNRRVPDEEATLGPPDLLHHRYVVLRRGRRDYHLLRFG